MSSSINKKHTFFKLGEFMQLLLSLSHCLYSYFCRLIISASWIVIILIFKFELYFFSNYNLRGIFNANSFKLIGFLRICSYKLNALSLKKFSTVLYHKESYLPLALGLNDDLNFLFRV